ncbi:MAG: hypothetical protein QXU69_04860 [Thermofilaceae archaeon]
MRVRCAPFTLVIPALVIITLAQPTDLTVIIVEPASAQVNLTSSRPGSILLVVRNLGAAPAENVHLTLAATGCAELLDERGVWRSNLSLTLGNVTVGAAKRVLVPVRCRDGTGTVVATAFADNADPSFASIKVYAEKEPAPAWAFPAVGLVVAALAACFGRKALKSRRRKTRRRAERVK